MLYRLKNEEEGLREKVTADERSISSFISTNSSFNIALRGIVRGFLGLTVIIIPVPCEVLNFKSPNKLAKIV
jgi:hypothetical protein